MSKVLCSTIMAAAILSVWPQRCLSADSSDWANLTQIKAGEKVQVVREKMKTVNGRFESFSQGSITVRQGAADVVVPKSEVVRVTITSRGHRLRNLAIGAAVGTAVGVLLGHLGTQRWNGGREGVLAASALVGLGGGTGIGAAMPAHPTVYRAAIPFPPAK